MTPVRVLLLTLLATVAMAVAQPALAANYDASCNRRDSGQDQSDTDIVNMWGPLKLGMALAEKACQGKEFVTRLLTKSPDPDQATLADVFDAARPELPAKDSTLEHYRQEQAAAQRMKFRAEEVHANYLRSNPANEAVTESNVREAEARAAGLTVQTSTIRDPSVPPPGPETYTYTTLPPLKPDGFMTMFESSVAPVAGADAPTSLAAIDGEGTMLGPDGAKSGTFENGELNGEGQEITVDGVWRGGNYENGEIEGKGFEFFVDGEKVVGIEGDFVDDRPEGEARVTYSDGTSRNELWSGGERIAVGPIAAAGKQPAAAVYKSADQLAEEEEDRFQAKLKSAPSAAALYAIADELAEDGQSTRAREAFRQVLTRFPTSPFALRATDRLAGGGGGSVSLSAGAISPRRPDPPAPARAAVMMNGEWRGDSSGNSVTMQLSGNTITVRQVSSNAGQGNDGLKYVSDGRGNYQAALPGGASSTVQVLAPDTIRVTNSDGWTDMFRLIRAQ